MCNGVAFFANNKKAIYGNTSSHSDSELQLKIEGDHWRKFEYLWWEKKIQQVHYDQVAKDILKQINERKAYKLVELSVKKNFNTEIKLAKWLKKVPDEWDKLIEPKFYNLAKKVNPLLVTFKDKIEKFKKQPIEKFNPYQAEKLPSLSKIKRFIPKLVRARVSNQVGNQVRNQVWDQVGIPVWNQVGTQVWNQVSNQVGAQVWNQVGNQVGTQVWNQVSNQVGAQVWNQVGIPVWNQVGATSYWGIKIALSLPIRHWFFDFLELGVMIVFVQGKVKVFGKKGKYLGEYSQEDFMK